MKLYNTLSRSLEEFKPLDAPAVGMYVCGPTVYDIPHIGHARSAYTFDVLYRYLEFSGYKVKFVRNVTDVDDKIIEKARQELANSKQQTANSDLNAQCREVAEKYLKSYHDTLDRLGIRKPSIEPKATEHVNTLPNGGFGSMTDLIGKLLTQGVAYEAKGPASAEASAGRDVYFAVRKFPGYGKLSNRSLDELQAGSRVEPGEGKQDPMDFALWKASKPSEPSWKSPWGPGRPGWHIECSAMSTHYLGDTFDIHGGGVDLVFPHHENEVAQAQAAGKPFARYWVHNGLLTVNGEKMSKSLGNYITVDAALKKAGSPEALKVFFLGTHYRNPIDYSETNIEAAARRFYGIKNMLHRIHWLGREIEVIDVPEFIAKYKADFRKAMDNDLNTPEALAILDKLAEDAYKYIELLSKKRAPMNKNQPDKSARDKKHSEVIEIIQKFLAAGKAIEELFNILGISLPSPFYTNLSPELEAELDRREEARRQKDFQTADKIRKMFLEKGFIIEDTENGPIVLRHVNQSN